MRTVFLSVLSLSFGLIPLLLLLLFAQKRFKKRFGAGWVRLIWIVVLVRLLVPFPVSSVALLAPNLFAAQGADAAEKALVGSFLQRMSWLDWIATLWLVVAGLLLLYHILDYGVFRRHLLRWSREPQDAGYYEISEAVRRIWKLPRSLKILICPEMKTPAAVGFFAPVILLPSEHYDDADLELILHHEAAHLQRGDIVVKWCAMAVQCLYWFHPLVYLVHSRLEDDLEAACDAAVLKKIGQEQEVQKYYSYLILDIAAGKSGRFYPFTTCLQDTKECLRARIDNIFDTKPKKSGMPVWLLCTFALLLSTGVIQLQYYDSQNSLPLQQPNVDAAVPTEDTTDQSVVTIDLYQLEQQLEEQEG